MKTEESAESMMPFEKLNQLKKACKESGREDLYLPLSYFLNVNVRWLSKNTDPLVKNKRYVLAANVMLYRFDLKRAREFLEKARDLAKINSARRRRLILILENLNVTGKIARRYWQLQGKYTSEDEEGVATFQPGPLFNRLLVAIDGSDLAKKAARRAIALAKRNTADLLVVTVVPTPTYIVTMDGLALGATTMPEEYYNSLVRNAEKLVAGVVATAKRHSIDAKGRVLRNASVVQSIVDIARRQEVDLIVVGTRGAGGFKRLLLGSVSSGVVSHAHCSTLVVR